ncbi:MAG TPA: SMR family transporter [Chitinophagales bacterium]|nr:EamA family transporter [Chitinophagales bacterium]MBP6154113.1 EamA family transporter [Chitinophagales bacterium]HQV78044.1 SMR family transporter [Chitinophagales bacterium]HQW78765.1 SMR family transporter [Chitinophagales bacterium]HRB68254.1 SMR family transporter [Chitinophagales bacterium]
MLTNYWIWLAIASSILTNIGFKLAAMVTNHPTKKWMTFAVALIFGLINSVCMTEALKTIPLNIASALFFSLTIIGLLFSAHFIFHDAITWKQMVGTCVIIVGVILINL